MDLELTNKVAIITGASRGIGAAVAMELAREGCDVALVARDGEKLAEVAADITRTTGRRAFAHTADLTRREAAGAAVAAAVAQFGRIDILINCAGATKRDDFFKLTDTDWADGFELKLHGAVRMCRSAWPHLKAHRGSIANIIGIGSRTAGADFTIGGSVNSALLNFTKCLADLGSRDGVRVNAINPGQIATDRLTRRLDRIEKERGIDRATALAEMAKSHGIERAGRPDEIGWLATYLASNRAQFIHSAIIDIDGGETRAL